VVEKKPAAQKVHTTLPEAYAYEPAKQLTQLDAPVSSWYVPAAHATHEVDDVAPVNMEYVPAAHASQLSAPVFD